MDKTKMNAVIVDDEAGCIANLQHHIKKYCPDIHIIATADNLGKIPALVDGEKIDIAFLDVELFDDNIFNALQKINKIDFKIIFVTAYEQYALKAWKVDALDYILKPLSEEDIKSSYQKIRKYFLKYTLREKQDNEHQLPENNKTKKVILKDNERVYVIKTDDIFFITGNGFYSTVTFHFNGEEKSIIISKPLNKIEAEYNYSEFFRIHKSYIINTNYIAGITKDDGTVVKMKNGKQVPVAKRRLHEFLSFLNHME